MKNSAKISLLLILLAPVVALGQSWGVGDFCGDGRGRCVYSYTTTVLIGECAPSHQRLNGVFGTKCDGDLICCSRDGKTPLTRKEAISYFPLDVNVDAFETRQDALRKEIESFKQLQTDELRIKKIEDNKDNIEKFRETSQKIYDNAQVCGNKDVGRCMPNSASLSWGCPVEFGSDSTIAQFKIMKSVSGGANCSEDFICCSFNNIEVKTFSPEERAKRQLRKIGSVNNECNGTVFCGPGAKKGADIVEERLDAGISKEHNLQRLIAGWTNFLLPLAAALAVCGLVWAGFLYITAIEDESRVESAKKIITWTVIGIFVIMGAYALVNTLMSAFF